MISSQFVHRRRVFVKRVASVFGMSLSVSLAGCSSQGISFNDSGTEPSRYAATGSVPIPSEPVYGAADTGKAGSSAAYRAAAADSSYQEPAIKRGALAPLRTASYDGAANAGGSSRAFGQQDGAKKLGYPQYASNGNDYVGGSYAMQPVEAAGAAPAPSGKRYAASDYPDRPSSGYQPRYDGYKPRNDGYKPDGRSNGYDRQDSHGRKEAAYGDEYIVREGDTLFSIAKRNGLSTTELAELNGISGSSIYPGQRLRVRGVPKYTGAPHEKGRYEKDRREDYRGYKRREPDGYADDQKAPVPSYGSYSDYRSGSRYGYKGPESGYGQRSDDRPAYADRHGDDDRGDDRYANGYAEKPNGYADRRDGYADKSRRRDTREPVENRYATSYERDKRDDADERYAPRRPAPKGSYYNYSVQPGDTLFNIARRNGLNQRDLAEYNDIPPTATLYPGQVLRLPKGRGYDWGGRDRPREESDERYDGYAPRERDRDPRDGYPRRSPVSQKAPADEGGAAKGERRLAKADAPESKPRNAPAEASASNQREPAPPAANSSQPVLAAQRDVNAAASASGGQSEQKDCEAMLASPMSRSASTFREPVQGLIVAKFGSKDDGSVNDGIDFSVPKGTPVKAAENGVVAYVGNELPGFGNLILVRHADGYVTAYAHNDETLVRRCDTVKRGEVIAKAGATGKVAKPQLHFELRKDSKPIDPEGYFSRS